MWNRRGLKKILKTVGEIREGDIVFYGYFTKVIGELRDELNYLFVEAYVPIRSGRLEEHHSGYIKVDRCGAVLYDCMENTGMLGGFLRRHGLVGPDRDWQSGIEKFEYVRAFRMKNGGLEELCGNLERFDLNSDKNALELDYGPITDFLAVGDYAGSGTIRVVSRRR